MRGVSGMGKSDEGRGTGPCREYKVCEGLEERPHETTGTDEASLWLGVGFVGERRGQRIERPVGSNHGWSWWWLVEQWHLV